MTDLTDRRPAVSRREFLATSAIAGAGAALAPANLGHATPAALQPTDIRLIHLFLPGGWPCNDLWDPKPYSPFRPGMTGSELTATVPAGPTRVSNIQLGQPLDFVSTIIDRATLVRSLVDETNTLDHHAAQARMLAALTFHHRVHEITVDDSGTDDLAQALLAATKLTAQSTPHVRVTLPFTPFAGFDAHEHGGRQLVEFMKDIDLSITAAIWQLEHTGELDRTILCVSSEFNRTIAGCPAPGSDLNTGENLVLSSPRDYGFHAPFAQANSILFCGGPFKRGHLFGKTGPRHPMRVIENPVTLDDIHATLATALGQPPRTGRIITDLLREPRRNTSRTPTTPVAARSTP